MRPLTKLKRLIYEIAMDNGTDVVKYPDWATVGKSWDLQKMEKSLHYVSQDELEILAAGEDTEVKALVEKYSLQKVDEFLNEVFDGSLSSTFFVG